MDPLRDGEKRPTASDYWEPFFLKTSTLMVICASFIIQASGLTALLCYSIWNAGILEVPEHLHQLWKYGPTASRFPTF